eukprot:SAG31_NODE_243_length_19342_cov_12.906459_11_plen_49_part_00
MDCNSQLSFTTFGISKRYNQYSGTSVLSVRPHHFFFFKKNIIYVAMYL